MTNQQIWTTISDAFFALDKDRLESQEQITKNGLCQAYNLLQENISKSIQFWSMSRGTFKSEYWIPCRLMKGFKTNNDLLRGTLAYNYSLMTDKEFNELK